MKRDSGTEVFLILLLGALVVGMTIQRSHSVMTHALDSYSVHDTKVYFTKAVGGEWYSCDLQSIFIAEPKLQQNGTYVEVTFPGFFSTLMNPWHAKRVKVLPRTPDQKVAWEQCLRNIKTAQSPAKDVLPKDCGNSDTALVRASL